MEDVLSYNIGEIKEASIRKISWSWADILILGIWLMVLMMRRVVQSMEVLNIFKNLGIKNTIRVVLYE
jgi:hypothetical protein